MYLFFFFSLPHCSTALYEPVPCLCMTLVAQFLLNCSEWNNLALGSGSSCCWDEYREPNDLKPRALFSRVLYAVFIFACRASACVTKWLTIKRHPLVWTVFISRWASLWLFSPGFTVIAYTGSSLLLFFIWFLSKKKEKKNLKGIISKKKKKKNWNLHFALCTNVFALVTATTPSHLTFKRGKSSSLYFALEKLSLFKTFYWLPVAAVSASNC